MSKRKSADKNKPSAKKSADQKSKHKSADKVQTKKSSSNSRTSVKSNNATKPSAKQSVTSNVTTSNVKTQMSSAALAVELEKARKRLRDLDEECREKVEAEAKKNDEKVVEEVDKIREQAMANVEKAVLDLQEQFRAKLEAAHKELDNQQKIELARIASEEEEASHLEEKRAALQKEIDAKKEETKADIERYRVKREADLDEQIKRLREQCEKDIADYAERRRENYTVLVEQLRQRLELLLKNEEQKGQLTANIKIEEVKTRFVTAHAEATERLNAEMTEAIANLRSKDSNIGLKIANAKKAQAKALDEIRARVEEPYREERAKLMAAIEEMEQTIKGNLSAEQRELERRIKKKAQLLIMLGMEDTHMLPDEELIFKRYKYKIERGQIVCQSSASTIYQASGESSECFCKVTMLSKWSVRHRVDFHKHSTRLARYLTANHDKAPFFVKVIDIMATDEKVYTFMEPLDSTQTLHAYLEAVHSKMKKSANAVSKSGLKKSEITNVLSQVIKACCFLDNVFVAHSAITHANIVIAPSASDAEDLAYYKVVLTGLTRPIVFYNVESDQLINVKGFDPSADPALDSIDHYPIEAFAPTFLAANMDVYAIGVLAYGMLRFRTPFARQSPAKILAAKESEAVKLTLDKSEAEHDQLPSLIAALTQPNQRKRILVEDILNHAYFKQ